MCRAMEVLNMLNRYVVLSNMPTILPYNMISSGLSIHPNFLSNISILQLQYLVQYFHLYEIDIVSEQKTNNF